LALAFAVASCGGDSGNPEEPGPSGPTNPTGPEPSGKYVKDLVVLKHPNMYSFEGAAPDLSGLQVAVYWSDSTMTIDEPASSFYILPPVAKLPDGGSPGTSCTAISEFGSYYLYYDGASSAKPVNVYIPSVVALVWDGTASTLKGTSATDPNISMVGKIPSIFEDLPFDASKITMKARYAGIDEAPKSASAGTFLGASIPKDYGYDKITWDALDTDMYEVPVTSNPTAWEIKRAVTSTADVDSKLEYIPVLKYPDERFETKVGNFYYVDKLEYAGGAENLRFFLADEEELTGKKIDWVDELTKAKVKFNVVYYTGPNQETYDSYKRPIDMDEYVKAMYTVGKDGNAKAAVPVINGGSYYVNTTPSWTSDSLIQSSILGDWEAVIACFYYQPGIKGTYGKGYFDTSDDGGGVAGSAQPWANAAIVPLTEAGKVYIFDSIEITRKKRTEQNGYPEVFLKSGASDPARTTIEQLVTAAKTYYEIYYVYVDPNDSSKKVNSNDKETLGYSYTLDWGATDQSSATLSGFYSKDENGVETNPGTKAYFTGWVANANNAISYNSEPGDIEEIEVNVRNPRSEIGLDSVTFEYIIKP